MKRKRSSSSGMQTYDDDAVRPYRMLVELGFVVALTVLSLAFMFPELVTMQGLVIQDDILTSDIHNFHFPNRAYYGASLKEGVFPLWTPYTYGGFPFLAHIESGACYPPNLVLYGLLPLVWAQNLSVLLPFVVAAIGLFLLAREMGANRTGAVLGALAFAYSGFFVSHVKHMDMVQAAAWVPWLFWLIERGVSRNCAGYFAAFAVLYAVQILAGFPHISYYTALTCAVFFAFRLLCGRTTSSEVESSWIRRLSSAPLWIVRQRLSWYFVGSGLLGAGIAAVQLVPALELVRLSPRGESADLAFATNFAYYLPDVLTFLIPFVNGDPGLDTYTGTIFWENYAYLGVLPLLLALYATATGIRKEWHVRFFVVFGLVCFSLVLGKWSPTFYAAYYGIPGFSYFRFPTRFLLFVDMALAMLAALGWTRLSARLPVRSVGVAALIGVGVVSVTFADLWFVQRRHVPIAPASTWLSPPPTAQYIQSQQPELFRMYSVGSYDTHQVAYVMAGGWQGDFTPYDLQRWFIQPNTNVLYGIESVDGYMSLVPEYMSSVWGDIIHSNGIVQDSVDKLPDGRIVITPSFVRIASAFNVKYLVAPRPITHPELKRLPVDGHAFLYENRAVMPRAYTVPMARFVLSDEKALSVMASEAFTPEREVLLLESDWAEWGQGELPAASNRGKAPGTATIESYTAHRVVIRADVSDAGFLVLADTYYPGWEVTVDGRPAHVFRANVSQRAVYLGVGEHEVVFEFRPESLRRGIALSLLSLLILVGVSTGGYRRARRRKRLTVSAEPSDRNASTKA